MKRDAAREAEALCWCEALVQDCCLPRDEIPSAAHELMPRTPIHPGEHLADELRSLGLTATAFAREIDVPAKRMTEILKGHRAIRADTALRLAHWFGTSAELWLGLQMLYDLGKAEQEAGKAIARLPTRASRAV